MTSHRHQLNCRPFQAWKTISRVPWPSSPTSVTHHLLAVIRLLTAQSQSCFEMLRVWWILEPKNKVTSWFMLPWLPKIHCTCTWISFRGSLTILSQNTCKIKFPLPKQTWKLMLDNYTVEVAWASFPLRPSSLPINFTLISFPVFTYMYLLLVWNNIKLLRSQETHIVFSSLLWY